MGSGSLRDKLSADEYLAIKRSFFHIYHAFLDEGQISKDFVGCLFKWAIQLRIQEEDLRYMDPGADPASMGNKSLALEHLYNLVYMIYLDGKVEDMELEVVSRYAEKLGFRSHVVNDLLKMIVTAPDDGYEPREVRNQIRAHFGLAD
jgi:hypothetical protein